MVYTTGFERDKSIASRETYVKSSCLSKTSIQSQRSDEDGANTKRPKSSSISENTRALRPTRIRPRTADEIDLEKRSKNVVPKCDSARASTKKLIEDEKLDFAADKRKTTTKNESIDPERSRGQNETANVENENVNGETLNSQKKFQKNNTEMGSMNDQVNIKLKGKKPSEIPKLKSLTKGSSRMVSPKTFTGTSKLPIKTKQPDKQLRSTTATIKPKPNSNRMALQSYRVKREAKLDEKIKAAMKDEFGFLVPLYESEFRKITDVWVNTLYCSLTMRTNLVKLLYQALPQINKAQFQMEDEQLLYYITRAKNDTKTDADNLLQFIKSLQGNREKVKEQYACGMVNREIAQSYNHDWKNLTRKITEIGEESKKLQSEIPKLQKTKEECETNQRDKIKDMETSIEKNDLQLQKLIRQLNLLKEKEASYKKNVFLKIQDYKEIKAEVMSLQSFEKEFETIKAKFVSQNEFYEKKIKDLEILLEEKKKILEKEKEMKQKLQAFLGNLQTLPIGKEQVDYIMGKLNNNREKRREQLWLAAVKLVLRGFLLQMKKLEKDRNKMLLELQSNDADNFNAIAISLIKRENFISSIKQQINDFQKEFKYPNINLIEKQCIDGL